MRTSRPLSLQWWMIGLVVAVALPALVLLVTISVMQVRREQLEARRTALNLARATASRMRNLNSESFALVRQMAARPGVAALDPTACRSEFAVVDFLPRYADVFLFGATGALVCSGSTDPENADVSLAAREWIGAALSGDRLRPGVAAMRAFAQQSTVMRAAPVAPGGGTIVLLEFVDVTGRDALIPQSVITIVDRDGTIVARSDASEAWSGRNIRGSTMDELSTTSTEGIAEAKGVDGVSRQYGFVRVPELGWSVYAGVPNSSIVEPVREMLINTTAGSVGIAILVGIMSIALARKLGRPIDSLVAAARVVDDGAYARVKRADGPLEITTLIHTFNRMVDRREEADERLRGSERKLKALSDRLLTLQEEERGRIARELHDDLGQSLTALKMDVVGLLQSTAPRPELAPIRDRILRALDTTVTAVQRISSELRPSVLDDLGLVAAIEAEARLFEERTGIECEVSVAGEMPIDPERVTAVYRIVQESLTNVARHANAARTEIRLRERGEELLLEIRDDGRGVTGEEIGDPLSLGLIGIRERAALVGGSVQFEGVDGRGTIVSVRIPLLSKVRMA